jgi:inorganic pyrophosphatase
VVDEAGAAVVVESSTETVVVASMASVVVGEAPPPQAASNNEITTKRLAILPKRPLSFPAGRLAVDHPARFEHVFTEWRPHPWHGLASGPEPPFLVTAYVEITPFDVIKYEVDKPSGYLKVDRPQQSSSSPPTLYGFIPRTYCAEQVAALCPGARGGDGDPLDICVISERPINRADILLSARVVGGLQILDEDEADDKIIAVLARDPVWGEVTEVDQLPLALVDRLAHYFESYKQMPGHPDVIKLQERYGSQRAAEVVTAAQMDYTHHFPDKRGDLQ